MSKVALALVAAVLSVAAVQDEMVENPEYKGWAGQKAGAWVKYKSQTDSGGTKMESTSTMKLKEITAEKAVFSTVTEMDMGGQKQTMDMPARTIPAKVKKGTDSEGSKVEVIAEGDEEVEIGGKKYACHWADMKITSKQGAMSIKVWRCDKIVGGSAKLVMKVGDPGKMTMTMTAVEWKAGE
jgi:uncharacterized Zn-binding protein involved in type VI secretion